jgi:hypothetical protein
MSIIKWFFGLGRTAAEHRPTRSAAERSVLIDLGYSVWWAAILALASLAAIWLLSHSSEGGREAAVYAGLCLLAAVAASVIGGFFGFLFGIPRVLAEGGVPTDGAPETRLARSNTNLEQVSDWLTKIVIGATLVQIQQIPGQVSAFAAFIDNRYGPGVGPVVAAVVVAFAFLGFLVLYVQTRTFLAILFARTELVMGNTVLAAAEVSTLEQAAQRALMTGQTPGPASPAVVIAQKVVDPARPTSSDPEILRQRGLAQIVLGDVPSAAATLKTATQASTGDPALARITSLALARSGRTGDARTVIRSEKTVRGAAGNADDQLALMFAALHDDPPVGFEEALRLGGLLRDDPVVQSDKERRAWLETYRAAALGQKYSFEKRNGADRPALDPIRDAALEAVRSAVADDPEMESIIQDMLEGRNEDDDLVAFRDNPDFREAAGL